MTGWLQFQEKLAQYESEMAEPFELRALYNQTLIRDEVRRQKTETIIKSI